MKNVDKEHKESPKVATNKLRYELRVNSTLVDIDNSLQKIEKEYKKSNSRVVQIWEINTDGTKKKIASKTHPATFVECCGGARLAEIYTEAINRIKQGRKPFEEWKKAFFKDSQHKKAA